MRSTSSTPGGPRPARYSVTIQWWTRECGVSATGPVSAIRYGGPRTRRRGPYAHRSMFATDGLHPDGPGRQKFQKIGRQPGNEATDNRSGPSRVNSCSSCARPCSVWPLSIFEIAMLVLIFRFRDRGLRLLRTAAARALVCWRPYKHCQARSVSRHPPAPFRAGV